MADYTVSVTQYGRMLDSGEREVRRGLTIEQAHIDYVPPFRVEQYFASDSYYFEVVDSKGQRVTDYDSEPAANWLRDYMNAGHHLRESRLQKWCSDCSGRGRIDWDGDGPSLACHSCGGHGVLR
jgi:hypothetical protein